MGHMDEEGNFSFCTRAKGSTLNEYIGHIEEKEDGVYLVGHIRPRKSKVAILYTMSILNIIIGILLFISQNPIFMIVSPLFLVVTILNIGLAKKCSYLKVSLKYLFKL